MPHSDMNDNEQWMDGHPDEGLLHEWLDEQLNAADTERVASHVQSCAQCQSAVAEARGLIAASHRILAKLDEVPAGVIPQNFDEAPAAPAPSADPKITSIDSASARRISRSPFRWQRIAPIAALLLVAVMYVRGSDKAKAPSLSTSEAPVAADANSVVASSVAATDAARSERVGDSVAPTADVALQAPKATERSAAEPTPAQTRSNFAGGAAGGTRGRGELAETRALDDERKDLSRKADAVVAQKMTASAAAVAKSSAPLTASSAEPEVAKRSVAATPPPPPSVVSATPPPAPVIAPLAPRISPPVSAGADSRLRLRGAGNSATGGSRASASDSGVAAPALASAPAPMSSPPASPPPVADSVVLVRNLCTANCELSTLHISALGVVRLSVGTGAAERTVTSQLSAQQRTSLETTLWRVLGSPRARAFRCVVPGSNGDGTPAVQISVAYPAPAPAGESRCAQSAGEISELAREIDAIAGTELLRQRLRQ
jgi:hypothetical protein